MAAKDKMFNPIMSIIYGEVSEIIVSGSKNVSNLYLPDDYAISDRIVADVHLFVVVMTSVETVKDDFVVVSDVGLDFVTSAKNKK